LLIRIKTLWIIPAEDRFSALQAQKWQAWLTKLAGRLWLGRCLARYAQTSTSDQEIRRCVAMLKASAAGTGFMHESYNKNNPVTFTRSWFAWANTLFGELIAKLAVQNRAVLED
jgi:meiotically up-regulated gene 157 (Mug157) protein